MVLNYQRWTPFCGCSFEQEVNSETGEIKLLFAHSVCGGHVNIAENTPKPKAKTTDEIRNEIIQKKEKAWDDNKKRNLDDFDNSDFAKRTLKKLNVELKNKKPDPNTLFLHSEYIAHRGNVEDHVDRFTKDRRRDLLLGLECEHALNAQKVYDSIIKENEKVNK